jgi:hypothetical protein
MCVCDGTLSPPSMLLYNRPPTFPFPAALSNTRSRAPQATTPSTRLPVQPPQPSGKPFIPLDGGTLNLRLDSPSSPFISQHISIGPLSQPALLAWLSRIADSACDQFEAISRARPRPRPRRWCHSPTGATAVELFAVSNFASPLAALPPRSPQASRERRRASQVQQRPCSYDGRVLGEDREACNRCIGISSGSSVDA